MKEYNKSINQLYKEFNTSIKGLTNESYEESLQYYGENELMAEKKKSKILMFLMEFKNSMIILLLAAAAISFFVAIQNNESYIESIIILAIVILNALLSFMQEQKADESIKALKKLQTSKVKVRRNNEVQVIDSSDVVPGDILLLEAGDTVPADCIVIEEISLKVDESSLTGESIAVFKNNTTTIGEHSISNISNMLYSSTNIVLGKCTCIVVKTGMNTQIGNIAKNLSETNESTPLEMKINNISKILSIVAVILILIMFIIGIYKEFSLMQILMLSISLAVAAVPEGLPAVITIVLSVGMKNMAEKKAVVRKMSSVETLGCTKIICTDKTGTITMNQMKVVNTISLDKDIDKLFVKNMFLNHTLEHTSTAMVGDPTEIAIYDYILKTYTEKSIDKKITEIPFDSNRKMSSVIYTVDNEEILFTKGSLDSIIDNCTHIKVDNKVKKLTKKYIEEIIELENAEATKGYRVLAYAYKKVTNNKEENNLIYSGLVSLVDPPRSDVKKSIKSCVKAGIRPIMITGDSLVTAISIAKEVGILKSDAEAIKGEDFDKLENKEEAVLKYNVYARVSPENKYNIVKLLRNQGYVVAMTGDGVNDAPALKIADIGVGMGISGTEVTKNVSDIILLDDSFSSIVESVSEGRRIYDNIRNVLVYLLTCNVAEVFIVLIGIIFGFEIFIPIQILYINLVTDSLPAIALAFEKGADDIMERKPRENNKVFFTPFMISKIITTSLLKTFVVLFVYFINVKYTDVQTATSLAFLNLILLEMLFSFSCKNLKKSVIEGGIFNNKYLNSCILLLIVIQIIVFTTPIKGIFSISTITISSLCYSLSLTIFVLLINEIIKGYLSKKYSDE